MRKLSKEVSREQKICNKVKLKKASLSTKKIIEMPRHNCIQIKKEISLN